MSHCTQVNEGQPAPPAVMSCPGCGNRSKRVDTLTVKRLVRRLPSGMVPAQYYFCSAKNCEVVYFPSNHDAPV